MKVIHLASRAMLELRGTSIYHPIVARVRRPRSVPTHETIFLTQRQQTENFTTRRALSLFTRRLTEWTEQESNSISVVKDIPRPHKTSVRKTNLSVHSTRSMTLIGKSPTRHRERSFSDSQNRTNAVDGETASSEDLRTATAMQKRLQELQKPPASDSASFERQHISDVLPCSLKHRTEKMIKLDHTRLERAERFNKLKSTAALLTTFNQFDMTAVLASTRRQQSKTIAHHHNHLTLLSAFVKASSLAMKRVPVINASIEGAGLGDTIVHRNYVDIGITIAGPTGIVIPFIRNVENLSISEIEQAISSLIERAQRRSLTPEDVQGGSFAISDTGMSGSIMETPLIDLSHIAMLGLHEMQQQPVAVNGNIEVRQTMNLALTYDHRLLDGREGTTFLVTLKHYIENPTLMLLES